MIASLADAWAWYEAVRTQARYLQRLGHRHWDRPEWYEALSLDDVFRHVEKGDLEEGAVRVLRDLDDLGVLLMFSVFEATVRDRAWADVEESLPERLHPMVSHAIDGLKREIEGGSFGRVTEAFKSLDHDLVERVSQVRRYRNWVAHGRRDEQPDVVTPAEAFRRLTEFLERMGVPRAAAGPVLEPVDE